MITPDQLRRWRDDALYGNSWRYESGIDEDYYDGNQYDEETARGMRDRGLPLTVVNVSRDIVQTMTGLQERANSDWIVRPDDSDQYRELAEVLALKLHEAERMTGSNRICLDAVSGEYKAGVAWVEVSRAESAFDYPYRVNLVPWREMWWDPRSKSSDIITDAEYLRRVRFFERDVLKQMFPRTTADIESAGRGSDATIGWFEPQQFTRDTGIRDMTQVSMDLFGMNRNLVAVEEFYYLEWTAGYAVRLPNGKVSKFDEKNPAHMAAYNAGAVQPKPTRVRKMNRAVYCGDLQLLDGPSPYPHDKFPFVPFVFDREARTGGPYGLLRVVRPLQDQVNTRNARMMWALNNRRVTYDADAVTDPKHLREEVGRSDAMIELNPNRQARSTFKVENDTGLTEQQFKIYEHNLNMAPQLAGVPRSLSGQKEPGIDSGVAIGRMQEMGINSQGRPTGIYRESRRKVGELLLAMVIEDLGTQQQDLSSERKDGSVARVTVNERAQHPDGYEYVKNNVQAVSLHVALDEVPATAAYRQQQFQQLAAGLQNMPPQAQAIALPFMIESSDMPNRYAMAKIIRKQLGLLKPEDMSPEEQKEAQQQSQEQQQMQQLNLRELVAKVLQDEGKAVKVRADTELVREQAAQVKQDIAIERVTPIQKTTAVARW